MELKVKVVLPTTVTVGVSITKVAGSVPEVGDDGNRVKVSTVVPSYGIVIVDTIRTVMPWEEVVGVAVAA